MITSLSLFPLQNKHHKEAEVQVKVVNFEIGLRGANVWLGLIL